MPTNATTAQARNWERAFNKYVDLNLRLQGTEDLHKVETLGRALAKQADELMQLRAPNFTAVLQKLYILWGETELHGLDPYSEEKRMLLEDFEKLIDRAAELVVMHPDQQPVRTLGLWPSSPPGANEQQA